MKPIPYGKQQITKEDINAVVETLSSDFLTQGPKVEEFERKFAAFTGSKYAVAVSNGTAALHLSSTALDIKPGDKVITTPITFVASANCALYTGAEIDFVDIDRQSYLLDLNYIEDKLKKDKSGKYKCIIPVDFAGYPVQMDELKLIADKYGCRIIEDACHAPGGYFIDKEGNRNSCGNGVYADLTVFSFHPVKHIATGEGGMITTNSEELYNKLNLFRTHGITKEPELLEQNHGGWYYEMHMLGYNYRITDIQSALGISQLGRINYSLERRKQIAKKYNEAFNNIDQIKIPFVSDQINHAYHLYVIQTEERRSLYEYLREKGIYAQVHYIPVHLQPYYRRLGWKSGDFPIAEEYYEKCLSLPMYPSLSEDEQLYVIEMVLNFMKRL